jgi:hypothetical protein
MGHRRGLVTVFGQVKVTRMAYRAPGAPNLHPADAALNLPEEKHSPWARKLAALESARGSFGDAAHAITRITGVMTGKRQVEELARRAAADIDAFYTGRRPGQRPDDALLVLTFDGEGIVMRPEALRQATAKAAATARRKLATRLSAGESTAASGWPNWPPSMTPSPRPASLLTSSPCPAATPASHAIPGQRPPASG